MKAWLQDVFEKSTRKNAQAEEQLAETVDATRDRDAKPIQTSELASPSRNGGRSDEVLRQSLGDLQLESSEDSIETVVAIMDEARSADVR